MQQTTVLIIGAGPTGLALAASLAQFNIPFKIIDKNRARSTQSKALGIQAGTLEAIEHRLGTELVKKMITAGRPLQSAEFNFYRYSPVSINFNLIPSIYNFLLILPQNETERLFEEYLAQHSIVVERSTELLSLENKASSILATVKTKEGKIESWQADFVVGCDGAHSTVRHQLMISFQGGNYQGNFILGDVQLEWSKAYDQLEIFMTERGLLACFPLKVEKHYRLILIPNDYNASSTPDISPNEFSQFVNELCPIPIRITENYWLTRFKVHHRIANSFRKDRAFLAGDAAHIHSPIGGQGMNIGIQDAFNLGFKLAQVIQQKKNYRFLDSYEQERYPLARKIIRATDFASRFLLLTNHPFVRCLKQHLLPFLLSKKWGQKKLVTAISEVKIARAKIKNEP